MIEKETWSKKSVQWKGWLGKIAKVGYLIVKVGSNEGAMFTTHDQWQGSV